MVRKDKLILSVPKKDDKLSGDICLDGSKSISNRVLIIKALCQNDFILKRLSDSDDTKALEKMLRRKRGVLDAGAAGTTFRFSTAFFAFQKGTQILTGTKRMQQRPIGILVDALRLLGANIEYLAKEGFPPIKVLPPTIVANGSVAIPANTSSQFISALLLIAPILPSGLELELKGKIVSLPYIKMTLDIMGDFGVKHFWNDKQIITIPAQRYESKNFTVEADWSAASYYYALVALSKEGSIHLNGLSENSLQGDSVIVNIMESFGVKTIFENDGVTITKEGGLLPNRFEFDFINAPDIAQTLAVVCGGLGVEATFYGLETLSIKETDRIQALKNELNKVNVQVTPFSTISTETDGLYISGKAKWTTEVTFDTYHDHRMAMALAPLALLGDIAIENPNVVSKSYPDFWKDFFKILKS